MKNPTLADTGICTDNEFLLLAGTAGRRGFWVTGYPVDFPQADYHAPAAAALQLPPEPDDRESGEWSDWAQNVDETANATPDNIVLCLQLWPWACQTLASPQAWTADTPLSDVYATMRNISVERLSEQLPGGNPLVAAKNWPDTEPQDVARAVRDAIALGIPAEHIHAVLDSEW